jgi:hypothetical protein
MRLVVHMGLHKTGSTFLQHLLNLNQPALADRGIWYRPQPGYPADREVSWALMRGNGAPLREMIAEARRGGCETLLLSSEDLEAALCEPATMRAVTETCQAEGVTSAEWHIVLRDPGATFASMFAQVSHHDYADAFTLFYEAMSKGGVYFAFPGGDPNDAPYGFTCFDHHRFIATFAASTTWPVLVHDFRDADPWPGWRLVDRLGALDVLTNVPGDDARNARLETDQVAANYVERIIEAVPDLTDRMDILPLLEPALRASFDAISACAEVVGRRYRDSHEQALREFGITV